MGQILFSFTLVKPNGSKWGQGAKSFKTLGIYWCNRAEFGPKEGGYVHCFELALVNRSFFNWFPFGISVESWFNTNFRICPYEDLRFTTSSHTF